MASTSITEESPGLMQRLAAFAYSSIDSSLGTASYLVEKADHVVVSRKKDPTRKDRYYSPVSQAIETLRTQIKKGSPVDINPESIAAILDAATANNDMDDRLMLLEYLLVLQSRLPPDSNLSAKLRHKTNTLLWNDLAHPPSTLVGKPYKYRSADGSGTCIWNPDMGKAESPYARSVPNTRPIPVNQLPDPGLLFDTLLKREKPKAHPAGLSSFFFAFANLVIHEIFNTDHENPSGWNKTSSYVDLAIIYGNNLNEQMSVRVCDGTGRIHPDTFADSRLLRMAPATPALLVLFTRNHNYVANRILEINEHGKWTKDIASLDEQARKEQDEDIFQTTRLIMCGFFISIVLGDYLAGILGLVREGNAWSLDILEEFRDDDHKLMPRGEGNHLSIEFVSLYHFHATISQADEKWVEETFRRLFDGKPWDDITIKEYKSKLKMMKEGMRRNPVPPNKREFGGLKRGPDGYFNDDDLARVLKDAILEPANTFGARSTPHAMRIVEMIGIQQNRDWGACSMNEFRKFLGLKTFDTFEEWNPDPQVAEAARRLYKHPDNLELYVGLQAEASKDAVAGAGLCPGYTVSRAILADAIALTRGDRFLTTDFTSFNLTSWGINECTRNPNNSSFGGMLGRVLTRALPNHFPSDSSWTCFPMMVPTKMKMFLGYPRVDKAHLYTYHRPGQKLPVKPITSYDEAKAALESPQLGSTYADNARRVLPGDGYLSTFNDKAKNAAHKNLIADTFARPQDITQQADFMRNMTANLIKAKSYTFVGGAKRSVDLVGDVINLVPVHFAAALILGLPLKTETQSSGFYYEEELHKMLTDIYEYILMDQLEPSAHVGKQTIVEGHCAEIHRQVDRHIRSVTSSLPFAGLADTIIGAVMGRATLTYDWLHRLGGSGKPTDILANNAIALGVIVAKELAQAITHIVDTLLDPELKDAVSELAKSKDIKSTFELKAYITESLRLSPPIPGVYREVVSDTKLTETLQVVKGERFFISLRDANRDPARFPNPESLEANRGSGSTLYGDGVVRLLGEPWLLEVVTPVIKTIFSLKSLDRARGSSGSLHSFNVSVSGTTQKSYLDERQFATPWSSSMTVTFEE